MSSEIKIRAAEARDAEAIYEIAACPNVVRNTTDLRYVSLDAIKQELEDSDDDEHILVAEKDGRVVGHLYMGRRKNRRAHMGQIGIAVHDDYQGQGVGTALMAAIVDTCDKWLNLKRLELQVFVDNEVAIGLYKKFGFEVEGTLKAAAIRDGDYSDVYVMARVRM